MKHRIKHHHYGLGTIEDERNNGHEKKVRFDSGECIWFPTTALSSIVEEGVYQDDSDSEVNIISIAPLQQEEALSHFSDTTRGFAAEFDWTPPEESQEVIQQAEKPIPEESQEVIRQEEQPIPEESQEVIRQEEQPIPEESQEVIRQEEQPIPEEIEEGIQQAHQPMLDDEEKSVSDSVNEQSLSPKEAERTITITPKPDSRRNSLHTKKGSFNDSHLNIIAIIIGVIFLTAVILATSPPLETEEGGSGAGMLTPEEGFPNSTPLAFAMLAKYFGTSVIVINTTPEIPIESEPEVIEPKIEYDDELFLNTIRTKGIPLTIITMQSIIAIDQSNPKILTQNIDSMQKIASESFHEIEGMYISPDQIERKRDFQKSMMTFISAASYLRRGLPTSTNERRSALNILSTATELLDSALRDLGVDVNETGERDLYTIQLSLLSEPAKPENLLARGTPFIYMDATRSNEISIYPRSVKVQTSFWYEATTGAVHVTAPAGKTYIIVLIQATHRGNLDGKRYTIQTPALSAFTLHGGGDTFTPLQTPKQTSLGEMYTAATLSRKESAQSSIIFEVPYTLKPDDTHLTINLGSTWGTPAWDLE